MKGEPLFIPAFAKTLFLSVLLLVCKTLSALPTELTQVLAQAKEPTELSQVLAQAAQPTELSQVLAQAARPTELAQVLARAARPTELAQVLAQADSIYTAKRVVLLMGSRFDFGAYAKTQALADSAVAAGIAEVARIEDVISDWRPHTEASAVNAAAGLHPVRVGAELLELVRRSQRVSELTDGAFDITAGGLRGVYRFAKQDTVLPAESVLELARARVDYREISINVDSSSIFLRKPGMRIGFGANGKGYAANRALDIMRRIEGVTGAVANASGDMATWGSDGSGRPWTIAIADPRRPGQIIGELRDAFVLLNTLKFGADRGELWRKPGHPAARVNEVPDLALSQSK